MRSGSGGGGLTTAGFDSPIVHADTAAIASKIRIFPIITDWIDSAIDI
jgi:hypothetical protein